MKFKEYIAKTCRDSSIHGLPYMVRRELHWSERALWAITILGACYGSISICLNQWNRFRENPITYGVELTKYKMDFPFTGVTVCTEYYDKQQHSRLVKAYWGENNTNFDYYMDFLKVVNILYFHNLKKLEPYVSDATLSEFDFLNATLELRKNELHPRNADMMDLKPVAITEGGLCRTTSQMSQYTNPFADKQELKVPDIEYCNFLEECITSVVPDLVDLVEPGNYRVYLHHVEDVAFLDSQRTLEFHIHLHKSLQVEILLTWIAAEESVRNLPIAYRKCRYPNENNLKYFQIYRVSLCNIECRIDAAMKSCNCKPYFYAVAPNLPVCSISGMWCLHIKNWTKTACDCFATCDDTTYNTAEKHFAKNTFNSKVSSALVTIHTPLSVMKRRVIFSTDQLITSLGGAVSFFLGMSFLSVFSLVSILLEFIFSNLKTCWQKNHSRIITK